MTEIEAILMSALIGGAIGIIGSVIGSRMSRSTTLAAIKITEFNRAAAKFRAAFLPQIAYLNHGADIKSCGNLREVLSHFYLRGHLQALEIFKPYLCPADQRGIERAWSEYCHKDDPNNLDFDQYLEPGGRELAHSRIETLLKFAAFK